jgi:hypothetical protein
LNIPNRIDFAQGALEVVVGTDGSITSSAGVEIYRGAGQAWRTGHAILL